MMTNATKDTITDDLLDALNSFEDACHEAGKVLEDAEAEVQHSLRVIEETIATFPFEMQVAILGRVRRAKIQEAIRVRGQTHCLECGCLLSSGCLPDCQENYHPVALTVHEQEEVGILRQTQEASEGYI